jgi:hypothetical protein
MGNSESVSINALCNFDSNEGITEADRTLALTDFEAHQCHYRADDQTCVKG